MGKNKRRKKQRDADAEDLPSEKRSKTDQDDSPPQVQAYLRLFKSHRAEWKFKKNLQVKLLKHYHDVRYVPDSLFNVFLEYAKGIQGLGRQRTIDLARKVVEEAQATAEKVSDSTTDSDSSDSESEVKNEVKASSSEPTVTKKTEDSSDAEGDEGDREEEQSEEEKKKQAVLLLKQEEKNSKQALLLKQKRAKQLLELLETA